MIKIEKNKPKKPFYKRWWFITIVVIFLIGTIGLIFETDEQKAERIAKQEQREKEREERRQEREEKRAEKKKGKEAKRAAEEEKKRAEEEKKKEEAKNKAKEGKKEEENKEPIIIEIDETVTSLDYTAKVQRVKIEDDILTVVFDWENQSDWDPAHFELLGIIEITQNGEALDELDNDRKYEQIKHGSFDVYDLKYKLIDDSDVTIRIIPNNEHDDSEGTITVSLE